MSEIKLGGEALSEEEAKQVAELLGKLQPGYLPFPVFHEVARLTPTPIIEVVPVRQNEGKTEILLLRRSEDDPVWPNALHTPGSAVRATDTLESAFDRVLTDELAGVAQSKPQFADNILHHSGRGMEAAQVYWVEAQTAPEGGDFYDVDNLPPELVQTQLDFIPLAVRSYKQTLESR